MTTPTKPPLILLPEKAGPDGNLGSLAAATVKASESAVVKPTTTPAPEAPAPTAGPTDLWNRPFDPTKHLTNGAGVPAIHPRNGKLICLKGQGLGPAPRKAAKPVAAAGSDFIDLEAGGGAPLGDASAGAAPGGQGDGEEQADLGEQITPETAKLDGEAIADALEMVGQFLAKAQGTMQPGERDQVEHRWKNVMLKYGWSIPFAQLTLAGIASVKYGLRVARTDEGKEAVADFWATVTGKPRAPKTAPTKDAPGNNAPPAPKLQERDNSKLSETFV